MKKTLLLFVILLAVTTSLFAQDTSSTNFRPTVNVSFTETNLPLVFINVEGATIQKENRIIARMKIIDNGDGHNYRDTVAYPNQKVDYEGWIGIKYRGNTSFYNSKKKPFQVKPMKTNDVNGKKEKVSIMGMGKDNDWALLAPWEDQSYVRDVLTFQLARPYFDYVPHAKYCEVILDGTYYGVYIMAERVGKGKYRLNFNDVGVDSKGNAIDDMTGDFHIEVDRPDEDHYYQSKHAPRYNNGTDMYGEKVTFQYKNPEYEDFADLPAGTEEAIHKAIDEFEDALASDDYKNPETGYRKYIDVTSFIDYMLSTEFSNNVDGYRLSTNLYKYSDTHAAELGTNSKWKMSLWDFNIAYGNCSYYNPNSDVWRYKQNDTMSGVDHNLIPFWWNRLMADDSFKQEVKDRWQKYRQEFYADEAITEKIDSMITVLSANGALSRDSQAWPSHFYNSSAVTTLKKFITRRLAFLDKELLGSSTGGDNPGNDPNSADTTKPLLTAEDQLSATSMATNEGSLAGLLDDDAIVNSDYNFACINNLNTSDQQLTITLPSAQTAVQMWLRERQYWAGFTYDWFPRATQIQVSADGLSWETLVEKDGSFYLECQRDGSYIKIDLRRNTAFNYVRLNLLMNPEKALAQIGEMKIYPFQTTGIDSPEVNEQAAVEIFSLNGQQQSTLQRGVNIVRYNNGTVKKMVRK